MIEKVDPESALIVGVVGGIGATVTYILFKLADVVGPEVSFRNLLPAAPPNPPIPQFLIGRKREKVMGEIGQIFGIE